jgi:hypothetical protein
MTLFDILMMQGIGLKITTLLGIQDVTALDHVFSQMRKYSKIYVGHHLVAEWLNGLTPSEMAIIAPPASRAEDLFFTKLNVGRVTIVPKSQQYKVVAPKTRFKFNVTVNTTNDYDDTVVKRDYCVYHKYGVFTGLFNLQMIIMLLRHGERLNPEAERALFSDQARPYTEELRVCVTHYLCYLKNSGLQLHNTTTVALGKGFHLPYEVANYHHINEGHPRFITTGYTEPSDLFSSTTDVDFHKLFYSYGLPPMMSDETTGYITYFYPDTDSTISAITGSNIPLDRHSISQRTNCMGGGEWLDRYLSVTLPTMFIRMSQQMRDNLKEDLILRKVLDYAFVDATDRSALEVVSGAHPSINNIMGRNAVNRMCAKMLNIDVKVCRAAAIWSNSSLTHLRRGCIVEKD